MLAKPRWSTPGFPPRRQPSGVRRVAPDIETWRARNATTLRFVRQPSGYIQALEVETHPRSGLFLPLCDVLFEHGIQIVGSRVVTKPNVVSAHFDLATESGGPIHKGLGLTLQAAILGLVALAGNGRE